MDSLSAATSDRLHGWRRHIFRWGIWNIAYRFWFRLYVAGWHNIPSQNPVLFMGNHVHALDPGIMISFYPDRDIIPLAKIEAYSQPVLRYFVRNYGGIPVERGEADLSALKLALDHMKRGDIVMLYAEGTRSKSGLTQGQEGSAYIALKTNAAVVPVAIWGTRDFPHAWFHDFRRVNVFVRFGRPFRFRRQEGKLPREHFRAMTDEAMYQIAALLPPEWRGVYGDLASMTTQFLDFDFTWTPVKRALPHHVLSPDFSIPPGSATPTRSAVESASQ